MQSAEQPEQRARRAPSARRRADRACARPRRGRAGRAGSRAAPSSAATAIEPRAWTSVTPRRACARRGSPPAIAQPATSADERPSARAAVAARRALLLLVRPSNGGRWHRAADHAGHRDQGEDVRAAPGRASPRAGVRRAAGTRARVEKPNSSAAPKAPNGRQLPKMSAASAMKPRPAVMFSLKVLHVADREVRAAERGEDRRRARPTRSGRGRR